MKKIWIVLTILLLLAIGLAISQASRMGQTSHAFAKGTIVLAPELEEQAKSIGTLYLIASNLDMPMPLGALRKKVSAPSGVVYEFVLTDESMHRVQPDQPAPEPFPEQFKLKARLDKDGFAGPDQPGDLVGEVSPVRIGTEGIEIKINRAIPY